MVMDLARYGSWVPEAYFTVTCWPSSSFASFGVILVVSFQVKFLAPALPLPVTVKVLSASLTLLVSPEKDTVLPGMGLPLSMPLSILSPDGAMVPLSLPMSPVGAVAAKAAADTAMRPARIKAVLRIYTLLFGIGGESPPGLSPYICIRNASPAPTFSPVSAYTGEGCA